MVEAGEITREQMQTRLDQMKERMSGDKSKKISKEDYDLAASKMARMVKAGEITREDMKTRLGEMRKAMSQSSDRDTSSTDQRARRARYKEASDKMIEMVEAGEITREQMEARLNRMKKAMASKDEPSDDCIELRKKLGEAVRNGEMTREEAGKIWEEEGC